MQGHLKVASPYKSTTYRSPRAVGSVDAFEHTLGWRQALFLRFGRGLLVGALGAQRVAHRIVAFMTAVFVDLIVRLTGDRHSHRPRFDEGVGIVDVDLVVDHVGIDSREALGHAQVLAVPGAA